MRKRLREGVFGVRMLISVFVAVTVLAVRAAGPWYVATNGVDTGNDGLSWSQPFATLSNAIEKAGAVKNETIWVSNGVYAISATVSNPVAKACQIRAWSTNAADTVLLGPGTGSNLRGVTMEGAGSLLEGFTVKNFCVTNMSGAGVSCKAGTLRNCVIARNVIDGGSWHAGAGLVLDGGTSDTCVVIGNLITTNCSSGSSGAGIYADKSSLIVNCDIFYNTNRGKAYQNGGGIYLATNPGWVKGCRIVGNWALSMGGGIYANGTKKYFHDCVVASNYCVAAGGIGGGEIISNCQVYANTSDYFGGRSGQYSGNKSVSILDCVFSNNSAAVANGGIYCDPSETNAFIYRCEIVGNRCNTGTAAGITSGSANTVIRNCLVARNHGNVTGARNDRGNGGAGVAFSPTVTNSLIENCTIVSNRLVATGSYVYYGMGLGATGGACVVNSVLYDNAGPNQVWSNYYAEAGNNVFSNSCVAPMPVPGAGNTDADPLFVSKETGNFRLKGGSPCIDTGLYATWMTGALDLARSRRIAGEQVDIGAFEYLAKGFLIRIQ